MSFSLSGIASGLDTNTIISQLMQIERIPYTKLESKKNSYNTEMSVFRSINTKLATLRTAADDLRIQSNFNLRSASNSDESVLKATASDYAQEGTYVIQVNKLATFHTVKSQNYTATGNDLSGTQTIKINGKEIQIEFDDEKTNEENLKILAQAVNAADAGVRANVLQVSPTEKVVVFTAKESGKSNEAQFADADFLGLEQVHEGEDAELTINGIEIKSSGNELQDVIDGISITLLKEGQTATVTVAKDVDKIAEKVEAFVKAYNDVIDTIRTNTGQGKTLQGDYMLRSLQDTMHDLFNGKVDGLSQYQYLTQIGLEIDAGKTKADSFNGKISFDKEKFKAALAENPDEVYKLFGHDDENDGKDGIAQRFSDTLRYWTRAGNGILTSRIEGYNSQISFITKQMEDMEDRLAMKEEQLKKQFTSMETMLIKLQNEQSWLNSQLAAFL